MKRTLCLLYVMFAALGMFMPQMVYANTSFGVLNSESTQQSRTITGKVLDTHGEPVIGASVLVKGTSIGTVTDINGEYAINAASGNILIVSYIGYITREITIATASNYNVTLEEDAQRLGEVVVTAMGIRKERKALGYSMQDVKSEELMKNKSSNVLNSLGGKIAGVNVTQSGGAAGAGAQIVLRGGTSLERDNQPLFVVDGVIYDNSTPMGGESAFDGMVRSASSFGNRVMDINPEDIENISVLKGPAAAALYGSRAAAGVIIITTKKGNADGTTEVTLSSRFSTNWVNRLPYQQSTYKRGEYSSLGSLDTTDWNESSWGEKFAPGEKVYNNVKDFFETGTSWDNTVTISGGNTNGSFYVSLSHYDQSGIIPNTGYDKTAARFNADRKYGNLTVAANVALTVSTTDKTLTSAGLWGSSGNGTMTGVYGWARNEDMKKYLNDDGSKYRIFQDADPDNLELSKDTENPYWIVNKNKLKDKTTRFTGSVAPSYKITDWLNVNYRVGYDRYTTDDYTYIAPQGAISTTYQNGRLSESTTTYEYLTSNLMVNAQKKFGDFDLNLLLGQTAEDTKTEVQRRTGYDFITPGFVSFGNIKDANKRFASVHTRKRLMGVYGEFRAAYKSIAYLTFSGRNDWTSTLPVDNRSYFYPSVGGSLVFSELLPENTVISFGKVRASWARVGKDTSPYATTTALWDPVENLGGLIGTADSWTRGNTLLKPEITVSTELGLEMRFLDGRLGFDFTYYTNDSKNQIIAPRLSQATGYIFISTNVGNVYNKGMELSLTGIPVQTRDWMWETTLNLSGNRGTVDNLLPGQEMLYVTDVQVGNEVKAASVGGGNFMAITGNKWVRDPDGNVVIDGKTGMPNFTKGGTDYIANREPRLLGGWNNSIQYKNWNLSLLWDFRIGGAIYNGTEYFLTDKGLSKRTQNRESLTVEGVISTKDASGKEVYTPAAFTFNADKYYDSSDYSKEVSATDKDRKSGKSIIREYYQDYYGTEAANYITNTSWLRLRSVSLSYSIPKAALEKTKFIKACTFNVTGTNLLLWTNYKGLDPENTYAGSGVSGSSSVGIDYCGVPSTAGMSFGVNLTF